MFDYDMIRVGMKQNTVMAEQIRTVDKTRLRKFLGTMTPEFMNKMQDIIDISLNLQRQEKVITKTEKVYVDKTVYINVPTDTNAPKEHKDLNMVQIQLLSLVDVNELFKIAQTQVETFLADIGMATTERMVTQSFVIACDIKKINYENVILELHNMFPKVKENIIKSILKENFKKWLDVHCELVESCPNISLMAVLKVFAKRFE